MPHDARSLHGVAAALFSVLAPPAMAQTGQSLVQLAKNPFADLTNLQFYNDVNLGLSPGNQTSQTVTFQPLIPFSVSPEWSIVTRTVLPLIDQPGAAPGEGRTHGVGDTQFSAFLSPTRTGSLVWAVGPVFQLPTATNDALGQGKWGAGPTAGVQWSGTQWTFGALINNIWSFAGTAGRPAVNQMQLQPEVNYTFKDNPNRYLSYSPTITANWQASGSERWTVPVSLGLGQLFTAGHQSINLQVTAYYNVVAPAGAGNWTLELLVQLLYPK
ncbi:MAG: neuromedin U [Steroidobacteraceae bacterium]